MDLTKPKGNNNNRPNRNTTEQAAFRVLVDRLAQNTMRPGARAHPSLRTTAQVNTFAYARANEALKVHRQRVRATNELADYMADRLKYYDEDRMQRDEARHLEAVKLLIERGADVNVRYVSSQRDLRFVPDRDETPLMRAVVSGYDAMVRMLIQAGADIEAESTKAPDGIYQFTPLMLAAAWGRTQIVRTLLSAGANVNHSVMNRVDSSKTEEDTPLCFAVFRGKVDTAIALLNAGAHANIRRLTMQLLEWALFYTDPYNEELVTLLVRNGANINEFYGDWSQRTGRPLKSSYLHRAVREEPPHVIALMLRLGADPNAVREEEVRAQEHHIIIAYPVLYACLFGNSSQISEVVTMLIRAGARVNARVKLVSGSLAQYHADAMIIGMIGETALVAAADLSPYPEYYTVMNKLIDAKAIVNASGLNGVTPLMILCGNPNDDNPEYIAMLRRLITPATIKAKDKRGRTAMYIAKEADNVMAVRELLAAGAKNTT